MANLTPSASPVWPGVYKKETTDPVLGGASNAIANLAELNLLDRSNYLAETEQIIRKIAGYGPVNRVLTGPEDASGNPEMITVSSAAGTNYSIAVGAYVCFAMGQEDINRTDDSGTVTTNHAKNRVVKTPSLADVTIPSDGTADGVHYFVLGFSGTFVSFLSVAEGDLNIGVNRPAVSGRNQFHYDTNEMRGYYAVSGGSGSWEPNAVVVGFVQYEAGANINPVTFDYNTDFYSRAETAGTIRQTAVGNALLITGGYLKCDGSTVLRADYPSLFQRIATSFGSAGPTEFKLPNIADIATGSGFIYHYIKY